MNVIHDTSQRAFAKPSLQQLTQQVTVGHRMSLEHFYSQYETIMKRLPDVYRDEMQSWYQEGIDHLKTNIQNTIVCKNILNILLLLFPTNPELFYFMGCVQKSAGENIHTILFWFQKAFQEFYYDINAKSRNSYHIENTLDFFKILFEQNYVNYIQHLMDTNVALFQELQQLPCDPRWLLFLGAYYIKTNQLQKAMKCHQQLQEYEPNSFSKDLQYKIYNNSLIMHTRMANFERIPELLKLNFEICHSMKDDPEIEWCTKKNVFCSNMLHFDYMYHNPEEHIQMCQHVDTYYPTHPVCVPMKSPSELVVLGGRSPLCVGDTERSPTDPSMSKEEQPLLDFTFPTENTKIRIGYISSDFVEHAVSHFILPILQHHNQEKFDTTLFVSRNYATIISDTNYSNNCQRHRIINIQDLSTEQVVAKIRELDIQILIDLNGYTEGHRMEVLAQRPAPIQISYLGFPNTVGSANILQYRITDHVADMPDSQQWFAEQRLYMPRCFLLYRSLAQTRPLPFLNGNSPFFPWIILGAMNRESKNSDEVISCWRTILETTTNTKILIKLSTKEDGENHIANYRKKLCIGGVSEDRILYTKYGTTEEYFKIFTYIDILLDTFPYSGTTTSCNALYNSVPVITLAQRDLHAHNVTASILTHCGMSEWVARRPQEYIEKVVQWANNPEKLSWYRGDETRPEKFGEAHRLFCEAMMRPEPFMHDYEELLRDVSEKCT